jgi:NADPH:quinone reductase-like Zn-dependent oxidoreductase
MRAAVIRRSGATPALDQFADPQPGQGLSVGTLVAAALNPLDIAIHRALGLPRAASRMPPVAA